MISKQHNLPFSESQSSVGISTDSDSSINNIQQNRNNNKRLTTNLEDIAVNLTFDDNNNSDSYIALPKKIVTVRKPITNNTFNNNSNSSESDFSLARLTKRRRYCSKKKLDSTGTNIKTHNKNPNNNKLVKQQEKITNNNNIDRIAKKYPTRKLPDIPPKLKDPFHDTDSSFASSSSSYPTKYSSSSDWKINSESDSSGSTKKT